MASRVAESIVELIGGTPLVRLNRVAKGTKARVYAKLEFFNPGGSIKDRIGLAMVLDAERKGLIGPGFTIVEPTSGNTGLGLAMAAILRGYKVVFTVPDKMSKDKVDLLRAVGARVRVTPSSVPPGHRAHYVEVAKRIVRETPKAYMPNQYENQANPDAHYSTTGPEIWAQTEGKVDVLVAGVGTGGTITGTGRYLKEVKPETKVVGVDPEGSILSSAFRKGKRKARPYKIEGIGEDFIPKTLDMNVIDEFEEVGDKEAMLMARKLAREEGILAGSSSGAALAGALRYCRGLESSKTVVVIFPDTGRSYLGKVYNDDWMEEQGFMESKGKIVKVSSIIGTKPRRFSGLITVRSHDTLTQAVKVMAKEGISHIPVVEDGVQVGSLSAKSMLRLAAKSERGDVESVMDGPFPVVDERGTVSVPGSMLAEKGAVVVTRSGRPTGIFTTRDVINYLARR